MAIASYFLTKLSKRSANRRGGLKARGGETACGGGDCATGTRGGRAGCGRARAG